MDKQLAFLVNEVESGKRDGLHIWVALPGIHIAGQLTSSQEAVNIMADLLNVPRPNRSDGDSKPSAFAHMKDALCLSSNTWHRLPHVRFHPDKVSAWGVGRLLEDFEEARQENSSRQ